MKFAVYCGASIGKNPVYIESAEKLGKWITKQNGSLVYGGGNVGLMGKIAETVLADHGEVIGVMPEFLIKREIAHPNLTELIKVKDMHERKAKMIELADCYIALPGGPGTLEEISEVISWGRIGEHQNPCILLNVNGFYDYLETQFDKMVAEGFLTKTDRDKVLISDSLEEIKVFIDEYVPPAIREY